MKPRVILVHGLWMHGIFLWPLARGLHQQGFVCRRFNYASVHASAAIAATQLARFVAKESVDTLHFVGHSLGGLVILHLFQQQPELPPGRVVLLGSPVLGSGVARQVQDRGWSRWLLGRGGEQSLLGDLPAWAGQRDLGVISGTQGLGVGQLLGGLQQPSDGTVAVSETRLPGARAFLDLPLSHTGLLYSTQVVQQVAQFLRTGEFASSQC